MQANELMVGDWVNYKGINTQVAPADFDIHHKKWITEINPIPLTTEILEKNGFYYDEDRKAYRIMGFIFLVKPEMYGRFSLEICGCTYPLNTVHELQHALKLCGINHKIKL